MNKKIVNSLSKKRRFSFEHKDSFLNNNDLNKVLMIRKMNPEEKNNEVSKEIDEFFGSPENYFKKNSPVTVGKKIIVSDMNETHKRRQTKLKTEKKNAINFFNNLSSFATNFKNKNEISTLLGKEAAKNRAIFKSKFEVIDNDKLKMIFDSYKKTENSQKDNTSTNKSQSIMNEDPFMYNEFFNQRKKVFERNLLNYKLNKLSQDTIPKEIKTGLNLQAKKLNFFRSLEVKNKKLSNYLSRRTNKPLDNLLLNRIDSFRFKKEIIKEIENNKPKEEEFGRYKWNVSLRRPDNFKGTRKVYVNLNQENYVPFWSLIIEKSPRQKNISIKPGYALSEGEINGYQKQIKHLSQRKINDNKNPYFQTIENLDGIIVKGKNLYNLEYKRELIDSKTKKIWHKVFVENGKTINFKDINKLFGNETFFQNYKGCITEKNNDKYRKYNFKNFE